VGSGGEAHARGDELIQPLGVTGSGMAQALRPGVDAHLKPGRAQASPEEAIREAARSNMATT
jgi:hypothetical protein